MLGSTALAFCIGATGIAHAVEAAPDTTALDEVVVTARLRKDTLLDVPVAVTAISPAQLARAGANDLTRISALVPQMIISRGSSGNGGVLAMRGISSSGGNGGIESSISIDVDGMPISRGYITQAAFFDLEQVEALKGPQALFFGKNSPGGVLSLHSAGPTTEFMSSMKAGYEFNARETYVEGVVSGPITSTLGARVAIRYSQMDGYLHNNAQAIANPYDPSLPLPGPVGNRLTPNSRTWVGRLTLEWKPTENFTAVFKALGDQYKDNDQTGYQQVMHCAPGAAHPSTLGVQDPYGDCKLNDQRSSGFVNPGLVANWPLLNEHDQPFTDIKINLNSARLDYVAPGVTLTSITGLLYMSIAGEGAFDYTTFSRFAGVNAEKDRIWTQEFRALTHFESPVNFAGGLYFEHYRRDAYGAYRSQGANVMGPDPATGITAAVVPYDKNLSKTYSGFGQMIWKVSPDIEVTAGARYTKETKDASMQHLFVNQYRAPGAAAIVNASSLPVGTVLSGAMKDNNWSPEATITWHVAPSQTLYGAYKSGYKSGGFSNTAVLLRTDTIRSLSFEPETAKGGEVGYKAELFDRRLRINSDVYYYKYDNLQRSSLDIATTAFIVRNAATATVKGAEFDAIFRATPELTLNLSGSYNDATYDSFAAAACYNGQTVAQGCTVAPGSTAKVQDLTGAPLSRAPKWVWTGGAVYTRELSQGLKLELSADAKYSSGYFTQDDGDPAARQGAYWKYNAAIRLIDAHDRWELSLIGRNLSNQWVAIFSGGKPAGAPGDIWAVTERPREIALEATLRY